MIGAGASVPVTAGDTNRANAVDAADYSVSPTEQQQQQQSYTGVPSLSRSKTKVHISTNLRIICSHWVELMEAAESKKHLWMDAHNKALATAVKPEH